MDKNLEHAERIYDAMFWLHSSIKPSASLRVAHDISEIQDLMQNQFSHYPSRTAQRMAAATWINEVVSTSSIKQC